MNYIILKNGKYEAHILPELGGNIIYFYDHEQKREILKGTYQEKDLLDNPTAYGMPLLLPPNRIAGGTFTFEGRTYQFPINEPERENYIHGFLLHSNYAVKEHVQTADSDSLTIEYIFDEKDQSYAYFPHKLRIVKEYELSEAGLKLTMQIANLSEDRIPMMFAYHTAFPLMGSREASEDMNVRMSINGRIALDEKLRGTENYVYGDPIVENAAVDGFSPVSAELDNVYKVKGFGFRGVIIDYPKLAVQTIYEVDDIFHYFVVWNNGANGEIFCVEPQTYRNNGINLPSWEKDGITMQAGEEIKVVTKLSTQHLQDCFYHKN